MTNTFKNNSNDKNDSERKGDEHDRSPLVAVETLRKGVLPKARERGRERGAEGEQSERAVAISHERKGTQT